MGQKIFVLGAGMVGSAIASDLAKSGFSIVAADLDASALSKLSSKAGVETSQQNFMDPGILEELVKDAGLVIGAAPGALGYKLMEQVIRLGKNMVDISFCPEDYLELDELARKNGATVVADMGVAPGMCNAILGYHDSQMKVESYKCIVGGLPVIRKWPLEYKSSWSPIDCIEEYTRPARIMEQGKMVTKPAISDLELVDFDEVGSLEEWNSDGLRSLLSTMSHIPNMVEKTLRYPGTMNYVRALRDLGFFSYDSVEVNDQEIRPIDLTANLLFPQWKLDKGEAEFTIMRVNVLGKEEEKLVEYQYDLYDVYNAETDTTSMARTTGYTCSGIASLMMKGHIPGPGVFAPEQIGGQTSNFELLLSYLADRGIEYRRSRKIIS